MRKTKQGPLLLFAPGAGAPSTSPWMVAWAERLATLGRVAPFDYDYMLAGRKMPDKLPVLVAAHRSALAAAKGRSRAKVVLVGKSMGARVGCHLANALADEGAATAIAGLVCFGYPLRSPAGTLRDEVLLALRTPILFLQGERDPLCPLDVLAQVRAKMTAEHDLVIVPRGAHGLEVTGGRAAQAASDATVLAAVAAFVARVTA